MTIISVATSILYPFHFLLLFYNEKTYKINNRANTNISRIFLNETIVDKLKKLYNKVEPLIDRRMGAVRLPTLGLGVLA
jgi:hypothetical protein